MNFAFFASHNGSSAHGITDACLAGELMASPTLLITNNENAKALEWAENKGVKTFIINQNTHPDTDLHDDVIADKLRDEKITFVICSGYMKLIGSKTIQQVDGKILNIHPSLLPHYGGKGMYGSAVHKAVKNNNESETGITIHTINENYDEGNIIAQKKIPLTPEESAQDIEDKVKALEAPFYIETLQKIQKGQISL
ncbi:MAG: phosphoribosylglycinamide formyltransferase [Pseudomonadota bacterium]